MATNTQCLEQKIELLVTRSAFALVITTYSDFTAINTQQGQ